MASGRPRIRHLPDHVVNQIAAGEVIERPASVLKELVENSLDAGARSIRVRIAAGGVGLIRVSDDGSGMAREDMVLAVERHTTSKISSAADLADVRTLGFRGEALASIAAVARVVLVSTAGDAGSGWSFEVDNGRHQGEPQPAAHPPGTTVEVTELFAAVPARRKFLRTERTESHHLYETMRRLALSRFDVAMNFEHDDRRVFDVRAAADEPARLARIGRVCGRGFAGHALAVQARVGTMAVRGWITPASAGRNQADLQYLVLNGRSVRDPLLQRAVRRAYGDELPPGRQPAYVLALDLEPDAFDVNVHPAKAEVRFVDARTVHDFLFKAVRDVLAAAVAAPIGAGMRTAPGSAGADPWPLYRAPVALPVAAGSASAAVRETPSQELSRPRASLLPVVTAADRYLAVGGAAGLRLIDAVGAWTEILERRLQVARGAGTLRPRPLLIPASVRREGVARDAERIAHRLAPLGFDLDAIGPDELLLRAVPTVLERVDAEPMCRAAVESCLDWVADAPDARECGTLFRRLATVGARAMLAAETPPAALAALGRAAALESLVLAVHTRTLDAGGLARLFGTGR
ncbi:MAG: DNA mismatch repair endonuclease MutL [Gammaproteobacteria bacterium]|nr:DNA mismatch repair endonuclease MutL [Gammaproteobacteria bacterium]